MSTHERTTIEVRPVEPLAVEFVSSWHYAGPDLIDELETLSGFVRWLGVYREWVGLASDSELSVDEADRRRVLTARTTIRELLDAAVDRRPPGPDALRLVNLWSYAGAASLLTWTGAEPQLGWPPSMAVGDRLITQVCASTLRLLGSPRRRLLSRCPAPRCVLFFTAVRPGQIWCSPACGNRGRVARHYKRSSKTTP
jgi:predicted RNA-binding Zn ribbon-like protein